MLTRIDTIERFCDSSLAAEGEPLRLRVTVASSDGDRRSTLLVEASELLDRAAFSARVLEHTGEVFAVGGEHALSVPGEASLAWAETIDRALSEEGGYRLMADLREYRASQNRDARASERAQAMTGNVARTAFGAVTGLTVSYLVLVIAAPRFGQLYEAFGSAPPLPILTRGVLALSSLLLSPIGIAMTLGALGSVVLAAMGVANRREWRERTIAVLGAPAAPLVTLVLFGALVLGVMLTLYLPVNAAIDVLSR